MRKLLHGLAVMAVATGSLLASMTPASADALETPPLGYYDVTVGGAYVGRLHITSAGSGQTTATFSGNNATAAGFGFQYYFYSGDGLDDDHLVKWNIFKGQDGNYPGNTYFCSRYYTNCMFAGYNNWHYTGS